MNTERLFSRLVPTLYEDDHVLAVAKPAGVDVETSRDGRTLGLIDLLAAVRDDAGQLIVSNRLSRFESGVLLLAKEESLATHIRTGLKTSRVAQEYVAIVKGQMRAGSVEVHAADDRPHRDKGVASGKPKRAGAQKGRQGATVIELMRSVQRRCLVRCHTYADNTHALRAQLRSAGLRLVGDRRGTENKSGTLRGRGETPEQTCLHLARIAFHHPNLRRKITVSCEVPKDFADAGLRPGVARMLHAALVRRTPCWFDGRQTAHRLITGHLEGVPGLVAERFGAVVILHVLEAKADKLGPLTEAARWYRQMLRVQAVYIKRMIRNRGTIAPAVDGADGPLQDPKPFAGKPVEPEIVVREGDLSLLVRPYDGPAVGLYCDHRDSRARIKEMAADRDVLNLFAYTCTFSVAAASGGANSTTSVDISTRHLEWGKRNFAENGLDLSGHTFIRSDVWEYFKRARRQGRTFDLVVIDPPTHAHGRRRGRSFSVVDDLPKLVAEALTVLGPKGVMMLSTNYRRATHRWLEQCVKAGAGLRRFRVLGRPKLPIDYNVDRAHARTVFLRFE